MAQPVSSFLSVFLRTTRRKISRMLGIPARARRQAHNASSKAELARLAIARNGPTSVVNAPSAHADGDRGIQAAPAERLGLRLVNHEPRHDI